MCTKYINIAIAFNIICRANTDKHTCSQTHTEGREREALLPPLHYCTLFFFEEICCSSSLFRGNPHDLSHLPIRSLQPMLFAVYVSIDKASLHIFDCVCVCADVSASAHTRVCVCVCSCRVLFVVFICMYWFEKAFCPFISISMLAIEHTLSHTLAKTHSRASLDGRISWRITECKKKILNIPATHIKKQNRTGIAHIWALYIL